MSAAEAEEMARLVSYGKDREWLMAKAANFVICRAEPSRAEQLTRRDGAPNGGEEELG
jgi:hypothetical protein